MKFFNRLVKGWQRLHLFHDWELAKEWRINKVPDAVLILPIAIYVGEKHWRCRQCPATKIEDITI
jgi:hypothetical protein